MKTYENLIEELMETSPVNHMGGGYSNDGVSSNPNPNMHGVHPVMGGMHKRKKKKLKETFAGCPVFEMSSDDFTKCSHGRNRYERWGKKMNMEEADNQDIRAYAHRNPGKPIIIKDSTYGTMSYLIPRQNVNESVELEESMTPKNAAYYAMTAARREAAKKGLIRHDTDVHGFGRLGQDVKDELIDKHMKKNNVTRLGESVEHLDESKMSEIHAMVQDGKTHEEIGKEMNIHPSVIKKVLQGRTPAVVKGKIQGSRINKDKLGTGHVYKVDTVQGRKTRPLTNPMYPKESVELDERGGEYDPEREHEMFAHNAVQDAEHKKGEKLTSAERKHHEAKAYHNMGYRDGDGARIEKKAGKTLTYAEMKRAKRRIFKPKK